MDRLIPPDEADKNDLVQQDYTRSLSVDSYAMASPQGSQKMKKTQENKRRMSRRQSIDSGDLIQSRRNRTHSQVSRGYERKLSVLDENASSNGTNNN